MRRKGGKSGETRYERAERYKARQARERDTQRKAAGGSRITWTQLAAPGRGQGRTPEQVCESKRRYMTEGSALETHATVSALHGRTKQMKAYQCAVCGWWHLATVRS